MSRNLTALLALVAFVPGLGCAMCASPYDYCGPTFTGNGHGDPCFINQRAGSILDPAPIASPVGYEYGSETFDAGEEIIQSPSDPDRDMYYDEFEDEEPPPQLKPQSETRLRPSPDRGVNVQRSSESEHAQAPRSPGGEHARVSHSFRR